MKYQNLNLSLVQKKKT